MNYIHSILQSTDIPLLTAFFLGLLVALNPCQLSINISALSYILKKEADSGLSYAMGKTFTYTVLGWIIVCLIGGGHNIMKFQNIVTKTEIFLPYILIIIGLFLLYRAFHHHVHHGDSCHHSGLLIKRNGPLGAFILGMTLALAFCPESAIFYFGIMIPMSMTSDVGILLPFVFGISASIPVLIISFFMRKAMVKVQSITNTFEHFQQVLNGITGFLFIILGIWIMME